MTDLPAAIAAMDQYCAQARAALATLVAPAGRVDAALLDQHQTAAHGVAWLETCAEAVRQIHAWAAALPDPTGAELALRDMVAGEYLAQMLGGIAMSQVEIFRPADLDLHAAASALATDPAVAATIRTGTGAAARHTLAQAFAEAREPGDFGRLAAPDNMLDPIRGTFRRFAEAEVQPHAQGWHQRDELIPLSVLEALGDMGAFGLTVDEHWGGLGLGKLAMAAMTEELSRGYIGVGSLGTRSEIAAELIEKSGTPDQRERFLPGIVTGRLLPAAAFTEPNTGSDLGSLRTRAVRDGDVYRITGAKTWITHAARADFFTLLARTGKPEDGFRGLSMFLVEKPRGTEADPFPIAGLTGSEIRVLGYRGMKEYELAFDGLEVPAANLLGGVEGEGFRQLMATFEGARIQTAARAVGVAQNALELGLNYARERVQFGKRLLEFPRISAKLAWMAAETMAARQLTLFAARRKDAGGRSDTEAGMAKLLAARVAWSNADAALQIHGGNGYAEEYPISRVLCDARILSVFEGTAEIQAQIIARGVLRREGIS